MLDTCYAYNSFTSIKQVMHQYAFVRALMNSSLEICIVRIRFLGCRAFVFGVVETCMYIMYMSRCELDTRDHHARRWDNRNGSSKRSCKSNPMTKSLLRENALLVKQGYYLERNLQLHRVVCCDSIRYNQCRMFQTTLAQNLQQITQFSQITFPRTGDTALFRSLLAFFTSNFILRKDLAMSKS